ncbi:4245_t:CDS:2, partial [Dentiscutata heterogama]
YIKRLGDEETIKLKGYDEFKRPKNEPDGPNRKRLWDNKIVSLCLLENYRCDNNVVTMILNELKPFKHNNVLEVFNLAFDGYNYYFVRGYYTTELRSYLSHLRDNGTPLSWSDKLKLTQQVVEGLKYLHDQNIIHSELHPKNIVIHEGIPKLTNVWLPQSKSVSFSYSPPEILLSNDIENKTIKLNIYSLGVLMWEISSDGLEPFFQNNSVSVKVKLAIDIIKGLRETPVNGTPRKFIDLYSNCWDNEPAIRPTCKKILDKLKNVSVSEVYHEDKAQNPASARTPISNPK